MKKCICLLLTIVMCLSFAGCGKSKDVKAAEAAIKAIGPVSIESGELIAVAEEMFSTLSKEEAEKVGNIDTLHDARTVYNTLIQAAEIESAISSATMNVSIDSEEAIAAAADAYNRATSEVQENVSNYNAIVAAQQQLIDLKAGEVEKLIDVIGTVSLESGTAIDNAVNAYDNAPSEVQEKVENYDILVAAQKKIAELRANKVIDLIDGIGTVSLESGTTIKEAEDAYRKLSQDEKSLVTNFDTLTNAQNDFKACKKAAADTLLSGMRSDSDPFQGCTFYYPKTWNFYGDYWAADISCFVRPYLVKENNGSLWVRLIYNYTGNSWVFFKKVIIIADGKQFTKTFNYYDIVHDNGGGVVWEYIDVPANASEIEMLTVMANAKDTIIRFEGDNYRWDWTMPQKEKEGINSALSVYELMK